MHMSRSFRLSRLRPTTTDSQAAGAPAQVLYRNNNNPPQLRQQPANPPTPRSRPTLLVPSFNAPTPALLAPQVARATARIPSGPLAHCIRHPSSRPHLLQLHLLSGLIGCAAAQLHPRCITAAASPPLVRATAILSPRRRRVAAASPQRCSPSEDCTLLSYAPFPCHTQAGPMGLFGTTVIVALGLAAA